MIRTAVIGVGAMGRNHVRVYKELPDVELVAIVDIDHQATDRLSRLYGVPAFQDYHSMLEEVKPQAVSVAVPTNEHCPIVCGLLKAGCHVLVEKPIAAKIQDALEMIQVSRSTQSILMVGHIERFNPAVIELKRRLDEGQLGRVFQIHTRRLGPYPTRIQDVGVILDLAPHDLDIMRYLTGHEVVRLYAEARYELHNQHEDLVAGILRFDNDILGILEINWLTPAKIRELYVTGEGGMFLVNYITQDLNFFENAHTQSSEWQTMSLLRGVSEGSMTRYSVNKVEPLRAELEAFIHYVRTGESPMIRGDDALVVLELALKLEEAAHTGVVLEMVHDHVERSADI